VSAPSVVPFAAPADPLADGSTASMPSGHILMGGRAANPPPCVSSYREVVKGMGDADAFRILSTHGVATDKRDVIIGLDRYPRPESLRPKQLSRDTTLT